MILLITAALVILLIVSMWLDNRNSTYGTATAAIINIFGLFICLMVIVILLIGVSNGMVYDEAISMYEKENTQIHQAVNIMVQEYMQHEKDTYKELKVEDPTLVFSMYPELKSDKLAMEQLKIYTKNREKIKELKLQQIQLKVSKWWLYFGH